MLKLLLAYLISFLLYVLSIMLFKIGIIHFILYQKLSLLPCFIIIYLIHKRLTKKANIVI